MGDPLQRLRAWWSRVPDAWRRGIAAALALRAVSGILAVTAGGLLPGLEPVGVGGVPGTGFGGWDAVAPADQGWGLLGAGLERFDGLWYLAVAESGYPTVTAGEAVPQAWAFFPGMPALVGLLGRVFGGRYALAAGLIALAATAVAFAGLHRLAERVLGRSLGTRTVVVTAVFPTAFFLVAPFSEGLFLATSVWALVAAHDGRWPLAAGAAAGAALTRSVGVLLVIPLAWTLAQRLRERTATPAGVAAVTAPLVGLGAFLVYARVQTGSALAPMSVQSGWQRTWRWPWESFWHAADFGLSTPGSYATGYHTLDLLMVVPTLVAVGWLLWRREVRWLGLYAAAHALVWLVLPFPGRPLMSVPRFAVSVAPLFLAYAAWTARPNGWQSTWTAVSAALFGVHFLLFVNWYFVF